jgi:hypothetical protein
VEGGDRHAKSPRIAADLVQCQQPEISVERRVFGRLGHHRTADLLEVHRCAQCLVGLVLKLPIC